MPLGFGGDMMLYLVWELFWTGCRLVSVSRRPFIHKYSEICPFTCSLMSPVQNKIGNKIQFMSLKLKQNSGSVCGATNG